MSQHFQRGDIVLSPPGFSAGCYCILKVDASLPRTPYLALNLVNLKRYTLTEHGLTRVGVATEEFLRGNAPSHEQAAIDPADQLRYQRGQARATSEAWDAVGDDHKRWQILAGAQPGSVLTIRHGGGRLEAVKFRYVLDRRAKYAFVAESSQGLATRYGLGLLAVDVNQPEPSQPRTGE